MGTYKGLIDSEQHDNLNVGNNVSFKDSSLANTVSNTRSTSLSPRLDPLLRDMLTWDLVERDPVSGTWHLTEPAQKRIEQLARNSLATAENTIYFDHLCSRCKRRTPTRLINNEYLCKLCLEESYNQGTAVPTSDAIVGNQHRMHRWRIRHKQDTSTQPLQPVIT